MHLVQHTMYLVYVFGAVIRVLHDLSVLHVVVILFTLYQLSANKHGCMDGWFNIQPPSTRTPPCTTRSYQRSDEPRGQGI